MLEHPMPSTAVRPSPLLTLGLALSDLRQLYARAAPLLLAPEGSPELAAAEEAADRAGSARRHSLECLEDSLVWLAGSSLDVLDRADVSRAVDAARLRLRLDTSCRRSR